MAKDGEYTGEQWHVDSVDVRALRGQPAHDRLPGGESHCLHSYASFVRRVPERDVLPQSGHLWPTKQESSLSRRLDSD
jgi:hypothetical protein